MNKSDDPILIFKDETIKTIFKDYLSFDQIKAMAHVFEKPAARWDLSSSKTGSQNRKSFSKQGFGAGAD